MANITNITKTRFVEGIKSGFKPDEVSHLSVIEQDDLALKIANKAREDWNSARQSEVIAAKRLESKDTQDQMADELFNAVMAHLDTVPRVIQEKVIAKFHGVNLPKSMTV